MKAGLPARIFIREKRVNIVLHLVNGGLAYSCRKDRGQRKRLRAARLD